MDKKELLTEKYKEFCEEAYPQEEGVDVVWEAFKAGHNTPKEGTMLINIEIEDWKKEPDKRSLAFTFVDCSAYITDEKEGKEIQLGRVEGCIGGGLRISIYDKEESVSKVVKIHPRDTWNAAVRVVNREDLVIKD